MDPGHATLRRPPAARRCARAAGGLALALLAIGCFSPLRRVKSVDEIGLAPSGERWEVAAQRWSDEFERGGGVEACVEGTRALLVLGRNDDANTLINRGLKRHPGDLDLLEMKGNVLEAIGFRRAAEGYYDQVLELDPERRSTLFARARLRLELGLATAARADIERCLKGGQRDAELWLLYGRALAAMQRTRLAFDSFTRAFDLGSQDGARMVTAASLYFEGLEPRTPRDRDLATAWLQRAVALDPTDTRALYLLGAIHEERAELGAAIECYAKAVARDPVHLSSLARLAELHAARGEGDRAAEFARRALELEKRESRRKRLEELALLESPPEAGAQP